MRDLLDKQRVEMKVERQVSSVCVGIQAFLASFQYRVCAQHLGLDFKIGKMLKYQ